MVVGFSRDGHLFNAEPLGATILKPGSPVGVRPKCSLKVIENDDLRRDPAQWKLRYHSRPPFLESSVLLRREPDQEAHPKEETD